MLNDRQIHDAIRDLDPDREKIPCGSCMALDEMLRRATEHGVKQGEYTARLQDDCLAEKRRADGFEAACRAQRKRNDRLRWALFVSMVITAAVTLWAVLHG